MPFRILIVEDDPDINRLLSRILAKAGYDTTSAFSGSEARLLKPRSFDLVLLDLMLPGATGEELIEEIRRDSTVPIIVISAKGQEDKLNVLKSGADDFISKPFDVEEVQVRVQTLLRRTREFSAPAGVPERHVRRSYSGPGEPGGGGQRPAAGADGPGVRHPGAAAALSQQGLHPAESFRDGLGGELPGGRQHHERPHQQPPVQAAEAGPGGGIHFHGLGRGVQGGEAAGSLRNI